MHFNPETGKQSLEPSDARTAIVMREQALDAQLAKKKRAEDLRNGVSPSNAHVEKLENRELSSKEVMMYVAAVFGLMILLGVSVIYTVVYFVGDR